MRGLIDLREQVEDGRLARAVGADETRDLRAADGDVEAVDRLQAAEGNAEVDALEDGRLVRVALRQQRRLTGNGNELCFLRHSQTSFSSALCPAWEQLCEKCLEPGIVGREHHEDEHDGVDQHTVICELAQCLGQDGQRGGGEEAAPDVAKPAEHHEHQHKDGGVEVELDRLERGVIQTVERAGRAGVGGRGDEGHELILREVQSDGTARRWGYRGWP